MVNGRALKQIFSPSLFSFLYLSTSPTFSHAHVSLHPLLCGGTNKAAHYRLLTFFKFCASLAGDTWLFTHLSF
jgi:hypothetical protein